MSIPDKDFREAFKPLYIPAHYSAGDTAENKVVYALAQVGEGSADEVAAKLTELDSPGQTERNRAITASVLNELFEKGLISGSEHGGTMQYNLSKITQSNDGQVDPNLLSPGLD